MRKIRTVYQEKPEEINYSKSFEIIQESQANLNENKIKNQIQQILEVKTVLEYNSKTLRDHLTD